jgi:hypothetical protein
MPDDFQSRWEENDAAHRCRVQMTLLCVGVLLALVAMYILWLLFGVNWAGAAA